MSVYQRLYLGIKRCLDIIFSLILILLLLFPLIVIGIVTAFLVHDVPIYSQIRLGQNKKEFRMYKFHSYKVGAPEIPPYKLNNNELDKYRYKWGDFLRATSIDELPQLLNIFIGDMSFVGPRPGAKENEDELIKAREENKPSAYLVKPGLTGYAQVKLKRDHDPVNKAKYDSLYVDNICFLFDLKILIQTITVIFKD